MKTLLKIENLQKDFGKTKVLKGVNLDIKEGEIISVLGPSGCGKSTMLRIISGILPPDEGVITLSGNVISDKKKSVPTEKRDMNMVFQDFALWPHMSVKDNITFGLKVRKVSTQETEERLNKLIELLKLNGLVNRFPSELSGGQQQRVAIARALITNPVIVLLDEPLCNLDIQLRVEMRTEMAYLFRQLKTTVFHVTHDPAEAFAMADRIIIMNSGKIDQLDTPLGCYKNPQTPIVAGLLGAYNTVVAKFVAQEGEFAKVDVDGNQLLCKTFGDTSQNVTLKFRPEECIYSKTKIENSFPVNVVVSTFEGSCYRVKATTANNYSFSFLSTDQLELGENGFISINKENLYGYSEGA
ncbi:MAG: ABC transporter [Epulopiscium sp. Nele67-Bin004]|nr:MAG: ABC transporter [Epulopiscium sp. Nele67-Bin004]